MSIWTDWLQKLIPPDQQTNKTVWWWYATHISYYKNVCAVETHVLSLAPTEQFLEYPEKLIFRDGNDVIIKKLIVFKVSFTCWKVQNLFVQIWPNLALDPVDRTRLNFQKNSTIVHSNEFLNFIELLSELTNLLAKLKGYQFNWDTVYCITAQKKITYEISHEESHENSLTEKILCGNLKCEKSNNKKFHRGFRPPWEKFHLWNFT